MENAWNIQFEAQIIQVFDLVLQKYFFSDEMTAKQSSYEAKIDLFDVILEGLSQVWLKYPGAIQKSLDSADYSIFDFIMKNMLPPDAQLGGNQQFMVVSQLKPKTKASIIVTFTRFLSA